MGDNFRIANLDKKQFLSAQPFGEHSEVHDYAKGYHGTAVALLVCNPLGPSPAGPLCGSWAGDRVCMVSADLTPDTHGFQTTTEEEPDRNLYQLIYEEFEDISHAALAMVCDWVEWASDGLMSLLGPPDPRNPAVVPAEILFLDLGKAAIEHKSYRLQDALARHLGPEWKQMYHRAVEHNKQIWEYPE